MVRKTGEQFSVRLLRAQRGTIVQKSVLSVPISAGLNASDGDVRFHFQGHSLPSWVLSRWKRGILRLNRTCEKTHGTQEI